MKLSEVVAVAVIGVVLVMIVHPACQSTDHGYASIEQDRSNMKGLVQAALMYAETNEGRIPGVDWVDRLRPFALHHGTFDCAKVQRETPGVRYSHALFAGVSGQKIASFPQPESIPFFFDSRNMKESAVSEIHEMQARGQYSKTITLALLDGHVRSMRP